ncbi:MAG TPA: ABC transporter ATP-binding protein [Opitutales bacterium]|nr:ABC transporter ATP-binding protein [Opitutales bacterium]
MKKRMNDGIILEVKGVSKTYTSGSHALTVLRELSFSVEEGATCAIVGPSGSGKTTLLGLCAGLDEPSSGTVKIGGHDLGPMSEDQRAAVRNDLVGFVFQNFQLIPTLTALENVMVPLELRGEKNVEKPATELLERVGLGERLDHFPIQLSGGEQQRVALARAFINRPRILFCDEPTGNLDAETSARVIEILFELNREAGTALILVTHDLELARLADRTIRLKNGAIVEEDLLAKTDN